MHQVRTPWKKAEQDAIEADRDVERWADRIPILNTFATVLVVILVDLMLAGVVGDTAWGQAYTLITRLVIFVLALHVSRIKPRWDALAFGLAVIGILVGSAALLGGRWWGAATAATIGVLLILVPPFAIARRLGWIIRNQGIVLEAVWAALSIYMLIGLVYASTYGIMALVSGTPFFVQTSQARSYLYIYFSFVTLTTTGYGDYTAAPSFGKMLAASEGLFGQLYLVTVVALIVSNFRGPRAKEHDDDAPAQAQPAACDAPQKDQAEDSASA